MNHPNDEQWMSYLYGELQPSQRPALAAHLDSCVSCRAKVAQWQSAQKSLDAWRLPPVRRRSLVFAPLTLKWAAAAVIFLCLGFSVGRLTAGASAEKVRAEIEPHLRKEFMAMMRMETDRAATRTLMVCANQSRGLLAEYATAAETRRAEDNSAIFAALDKLGAQRVADYLSLKKDVDTVALNTDAGLRSAQQELTALEDAVPSHGKHISN